MFCDVISSKKNKSGSVCRGFFFSSPSLPLAAFYSGSTLLCHGESYKPYYGITLYCRRTITGSRPADLLAGHHELGTI